MELKTIRMALLLLLWGFVIGSAGVGMADEPWQPMSDEEIESREWEQLATTLNEFTNRLKNPRMGSGYAGAALDEEEMEEAIELLRARYPFVSIRQRIDHLQRFDTGVRRPDTTQSQSVKTKVHAAIAVRNASLRALHSDKVRDFISEPGNGVGRFPPASPARLPLFESKFAGFDNAPVQSEVLNESTSYKQSFAWPIANRSRAASGREIPPKPTSLERSVRSFYNRTVFRFASEYSTGYFKSVDEVAGFEAHRVRLWEGWEAKFGEASFGEVSTWLDEAINPEFNPEFNPEVNRDPDQKVEWRVNRMQLVSLLLHQQPSVYLTDQLPNMEELSSQDAPVRDVDAFEDAALGQLKAGEDVVLEASANRIRMVGSVRSRESCINCHTTAKVGDLLGAFSYEILRSPLLPQGENKTAY